LARPDRLDNGHRRAARAERGCLRDVDSVGVYAKQTPEGDLIVEVLVFNPDWDKPLRIACIRSRPADRSCLRPLVCGLEHVTP
jgi:hypothetical protein